LGSSMGCSAPSQGGRRSVGTLVARELPGIRRYIKISRM
jgi:uncharacterized protein DUF6893